MGCRSLAAPTLVMAPEASPFPTNLRVPEWAYVLVRPSSILLGQRGGWLASSARYCTCSSLDLRPLHAQSCYGGEGLQCQLAMDWTGKCQDSYPCRTCQSAGASPHWVNLILLHLNHLRPNITSDLPQQRQLSAFKPSGLSASWSS